MPAACGHPKPAWWSLNRRIAHVPLERGLLLPATPASNAPLLSPPRCSCKMSGGHSDDGFEVQPARAALQLRGVGPVLCYASHRPVSVTVLGEEAAFAYDDGAAALRFDLPAGAAAGDAKAVAIQF